MLSSNGVLSFYQGWTVGEGRLVSLGLDLASYDRADKKRNSSRRPPHVSTKVTLRNPGAPFRSPLPLCPFLSAPRARPGLGLTSRTHALVPRVLCTVIELLPLDTNRPAGWAAPPEVLHLPAADRFPQPGDGREAAPV